MDHQYIQDNQLVERYLQDKLSEEEKAAFEEHYLSDAETLAQQLPTLVNRCVDAFLVASGLSAFIPGLGGSEAVETIAI